MVWGCMMGTKLGKLHRISSRMKAEDYINILESSFMESLDIFGVEKETVLFQQDNDPKHCARKTMEWFETNSIMVMEWPSQSPDLNIIEHVWSLVKRKLGYFSTDPKNLDELWLRTKTVWEGIKEEEIVRIFNSLPRRIDGVINVKGGHTKY